MWPQIAPISSLLTGVALLLLGNGLLNTLLTLKGAEQGYSTTLLGLIMSGYFTGYFLGNWLGGPLIRRVGHIRAFAFCCALAAICALLHVLIINPWVWVALRLIYGVALICLYMVIESWLNARANSDNRGKILALYMAVNLGALALGQQLLRLDTSLGFTLFALAGMIIVSALMPVTLTRQLQPTLPDSPSANLREMLRIAPLALAASALSGLGLSGFWGMAPAYANLISLDAAGVGLLMTLTILGGALLQWPIGRYSDRHDRRKVLSWVVAGAALAAATMVILGPGTPLLALFFLFGGLSFAIYPLAVALLIDQLHPDEVLSGSASLLLVNGIGSSCGPLLAGLLMQQFGAVALPVYFTATLGVLAMYAFYRIHRVSDLIAESPAQFVPMLRTGPTALEMVPEAPTPDAEPPGTR
ncbi:MFS transporter [Aquipseudomonas ullengensis]|uniref:MFS transporter n=1 Tax=Aquipseudomonas ullengensis TaxID=2759166 RepID=A0A7W4QBJ2_9GAMM|nr:MFS transporter [Pseudomonas ullengensis]MBB2496515.1 MFS transporter [Pseudomonas ullengensis]